MTETARSLKADGWAVIHDDGFIDLVGPLWHRVVDGQHEYAIATAAKHRNRRGLVQGGLMMTLADRASGMAAREQSGAPHVATVQLDTHFVDAGEIGDLLIARPRVVRATRSLIFTSTEVSVDGRCVILANGVFKIVRPR
ncbi:Thioesterase superfamily [Rhodopseudomonas palustris HaA2]|uniref:Thioesterase superfamily n=1 Tax=Rhodopseudomonas palustris (strain HaA2) TaxID=316058 RepID=Q2IRY3_RHOP2|nr:PaaI family thioesterase [Rhodopseudomonas palustris]ABD09027.1 Thioesterase superfamily [Rhodopseudomonas palustris HaA2]